MCKGVQSWYISLRMESIILSETIRYAKTAQQLQVERTWQHATTQARQKTQVAVHICITQNEINNARLLCPLARHEHKQMDLNQQSRAATFV